MPRLVGLGPGYREVSSAKPCERCIDRRQKAEEKAYWDGLRRFGELLKRPEEPE